jgi:hypothetical protein
MGGGIIYDTNLINGALFEFLDEPELAAIIFDGARIRSCCFPS